MGKVVQLFPGGRPMTAEQRIQESIRRINQLIAELKKGAKQ